MAIQPDLCITVPAEAGSLRRVRQAVAALARPMPVDVARRVLMAVNEAATNVVIHAYRGHPAPGPLIVSARVRPTALTVEVRDKGSGVRTRDDSPGLGAGLRVMAALSSQMDVERCAPGTSVRMQFRTPTHE